MVDLLDPRYTLADFDRSLKRPRRSHYNGVEIFACLLNRGTMGVMNGILRLIAAVTLVLCTSAVWAQEWGHLKGRVLVDGSVESLATLNPDKDRDYCLADGHELVNELIVVGGDGGLRDVYVMLYLARGDQAPPVHPSFEELKKKPVVLDNNRCRFEPHAAFVRTGQVLTMRNSDQIGHNIHTLNVDEKNKNVPVGGSVDVTYEQPDRIPADVECNIHPFMKGLLLVRDDPYATITNDKGEFLLENLPAGNWKFQFWHKKTGYLSMLTRDGKPFLERRGEFSLEIKPGATIDLGDLTLAASVLNKKD